MWRKMNIDQNTPTENDDFENLIIVFSQHNKDKKIDDKIKVFKKRKIKYTAEALNWLFGVWINYKFGM